MQRRGHCRVQGRAWSRAGFSAEHCAGHSAQHSVVSRHGYSTLHSAGNKASVLRNTVQCKVPLQAKVPGIVLGIMLAGVRCT